MGIYQSFTDCKYFQKEGSYEQCIGCDMVKCPKYKRIIHSKKNDPVNRPAHYTDGKIEVIEYIEDKKLGFCLGNAVKYISRAGKKDPTKEVEDLKKAIWYIDRRIKEINEKPIEVITKEKHEAPFSCKLGRFLFGYSPSIAVAKCTLGQKHARKRCKGCKCNIRESAIEILKRIIGGEKK